jgi:hypothetical protein
MIWINVIGIILLVFECLFFIYTISKKRQNRPAVSTLGYPHGIQRFPALR